MNTMGIIVQGILVLVAMGIVLYLLYFYFGLRRQKRHLLQQLHCKQQLTEKTFAEIHNGLHLPKKACRDVAMLRLYMIYLLANLRMIATLFYYLF